MKGMEQELLKKLAIDVVKYQNFQIKSAVSKLDYPLTNVTLIQYMSKGVRYIKTGLISGKAPKNFFVYIDEALSQHVQPLTPSKYEKRTHRKYSYTSKQAHPPVERLSIVNKPLTDKFVYGVKRDNAITLFENEKDAKTFMQGIKFVGMDQSVQCVTVTFQETNLE